MSPMPIVLAILTGEVDHFNQAHPGQFSCAPKLLDPKRIAEVEVATILPTDQDRQNATRSGCHQPTRAALRSLTSDTETSDVTSEVAPQTRRQPLRRDAVRARASAVRCPPTPC